ncbi:MAG: hypothetical protein N838_25185 [Thiohalocapsa sp. PB-PSB1]|jgi:hypothetical protein|nr:MAG: hypothetical protein N838_14125 [Thiohalocapsa sp. PB-PSB1]QQO56159.1 MAG: hypothetical protein N838_25185 [Thiohalocapsa sp. PB-PSB1]
MAQPRSAETLLDLFASETVVDLPRIQLALGGASSMTAFRYLRQIPYRRSYNHNGRYYCLYEPSRYDRLGLWSVGDVHFSVDGSLAKTVRRLVHEMEAGATHRELQDRVRVRVHNTLLTLLRRGEIERERLAQLYVYLHSDADQQTTPLCRSNRDSRLQHRIRVLLKGEQTVISGTDGQESNRCLTR